MEERDLKEGVNQKKTEEVTDENCCCGCTTKASEPKEDVEEKRDEISDEVSARDDNGQKLTEENGETEDQSGEKSPEIIALEEEKEALINRLRRLQADFDNYRKRVMKEREELIERANEKLLINLLSIVDNLERAIEAGNENSESFYQGVLMIYNQFIGLLEKEGVKPINAEGECFDPEKHHAVIKEPAPVGVAEDTVMQVLQKGYLYKEKVLRPAMVKVAE